MLNLAALLERCESDTAKLLNQGAANRLAAWRKYRENQPQLIAFIQRLLRGEARSNGWELDRKGGLSIERIVIDNSQLFTTDDVRAAKDTLGIP